MRKIVKNNILYIGNYLDKSKIYASSMKTLSDCLKNEGNNVILTSQKENKFFRIFDMIFSLLINYKKVDIVLIDVFSTTAFYFSYITSSLCYLLNIDYITILRGGNLPDRLDKSPKLCNKIFKKAKYNVAPSNYLKTKFMERGYKVKFIPNIINIGNYHFKERTEVNPKLLWVRAFADIYNPILAIEVLNDLKKIYPEATLCMIGPDRDGSRKDVENKVIELNLKNSVEFTGALKKADWIKKSEDYDIFLNTTNVDNTPVSVIEAMALGLPIVSTNVGGIPYLLEHKKTGLLIKPRSRKEMLSSILELINGDHHDLSKNARKLAETFDWNNVKQSWYKILN